MNKYLEKLLDGQTVEWKALGEVLLSITTGLNPRKNFTLNNNEEGELTAWYITTKDYSYNEKIEFIEGKTARITEKARKIINKRSKLAKGDLLFSAVGTVGKIALVENEPTNFDVNESTFVLKPDTEQVLSKFLRHYLRSELFQSRMYSMQKGSTMAGIRKGDLEKFIIPLPPLSVQKEIVKVLDKMTDLCYELARELALRQKQYEYYRDCLIENVKLRIENEQGWGVIKELGEVVLKTSNIKWQETDKTYKYIDLTSVSRENNSITETISINNKNAPSRAKKLVEQDDVIFATTRPTQMRICLIEESFAYSIASTGYCVLRAKHKEILPKWIFYNLSCARFRNYLEENQSGSAYPAISDNKLKEYKIPIPPLAEQERIVNILDKFDRLTHSITQGLPKEIALRQKQYEYYRDLLVTFPKPIAETP